MELEQAVHELEILRAEELRASQGRESPLTEALAVAIHTLRSPTQNRHPGESTNNAESLERAVANKIARLDRVFPDSEYEWSPGAKEKLARMSIQGERDFAQLRKKYPVTA